MPSKVRVLCLIFLLILLAGPTTAAPPTESRSSPWTLERAMQFALRHNPDIRALHERIQAADAEIRAAQAAFFPELSLSGGYTRTNNPMYSFGNILNQGQFSDRIDFNDPGTTDSLLGTASLQYNLYRGGRDSAALAAARAQAQAALHERTALRLRLEFEVMRAIFTLVQANEIIQTRQAALEAAHASLAVGRSRYGEGILLREDLLNLEVQKALAEEELITARHGLLLAQRGFLYLLGADADNRDIHPVPALPAEQPLPGPGRTIDHRPELAAIKALISAQEAVVRQARSGYLPTIDAFGRYQVDQGSELDAGSGNSWTTGILIHYVLFNGRRTGAETDQAEARLREAKEQRRKLQLALDLEQEQARLALKREEARLQVSGDRLRAAEESARLARLRFREGLMLASELIDSETRLTDARLNHTLTTTSRRIALADLRRTVGLPQSNQEQ
ncbi:MAG: TolC family protein [Desulfobulbus sp.]|jgi:outer membrane protein TolC